MTFSFRPGLRFVATLVATLGIISGAPMFSAAQDGIIPPIAPSASGSFLAGQEAFRDMRTKDAASYFLDASEAEWENPAIVERAFMALAADGRITDAAALAQHLLELRPEDELARLVLGTVALKERRYASAISQLENIGADSFIGITSALTQSWALVGDDRYEESQVLLDEMGREGLDEFLIFHRALMADVAGEREEAIQFASVAYEFDPYVARIVEAYARILANASLFSEASEVIARYTDEGLSHPLIKLVSEAISEEARPGKLAADVQAGAAEMYHGIGAALARDGAGDTAMIFLRLGHYLDPNVDVIVMALGQLMEIAGRPEEAIEIYAQVADTSPMKPEAAIDIAENIDTLGDREEAIKRLMKISEQQPDNLNAFSVLGDLLRYDEQYGKAAEAYTKALAVAGGDRPRDWRFYYVRGIVYERDNQWPKAEADFLRALELNPSHPQVLNYLGYSWVDQNLNLEQALEMIREAVEANPTDGYIVDSLGWAYYRLHRIEEAVQVLEQAVRLKPNDPEINDHLGDAYWQAGRKLEAQFQWTVASEVDDSNGEVTERAVIKLADGLDALDADE